MGNPDSELKPRISEDIAKRNAVSFCLNELTAEIMLRHGLVSRGVNASNSVVSAFLQTEATRLMQINSDSSTYENGQFLATVRELDQNIYRSIRNLPRDQRPPEGSEDQAVIKVILEPTLVTRTDLTKLLDEVIPMPRNLKKPIFPPSIHQFSTKHN